jgi:hypothetical protein
MTKDTRSRSVISGKFVSPETAAKRPATTVTEAIGGKSTNGVHRSAKTGLFVTDAYAKRHPNTTMKDS